MSDPLAGMQTTYCENCGDQYPVEEFAWSDTDEVISAYYARHRAKATPGDMWWCGNGGLAVLAAVGLLGGIVIGVGAGMATTFFVGLAVGVVGSLLGAIAGVLLRESFVAPRIARRVCGVDDTRSLQ